MDKQEDRLIELNAAYQRRQHEMKACDQEAYNKASWEYAEVKNWFFQHNIVLWIDAGEWRLATEAEQALLTKPKQ